MITCRNLIEFILFFGILVLTTKPLGIYMEKVFDGSQTLLSFLFRPIENIFYSTLKINPKEEQRWTTYTFHLLIFSAISTLFTYAILRLQDHLPLNPRQLAGLSPHLAFNTAVSFMTNTDWQSYSGETTLSYFSQMVGLTLQNFLSASVGLSAAIALIRGLARSEGSTIGNFWTDMIRSNLYILLPLSILFSVFYISQGMIQNFLPYQDVLTLEGQPQLIAQGPAASQVAIKLLGTNGGGFFNANSAHPYENPTPLCNFFQMISILLIPCATIFLLGKKVGHVRHGWTVWITFSCLLGLGILTCSYFEFQGSQHWKSLGSLNSINMEGKETRFGIFESSLFTTITTATSCGAVNTMHDSLTPLGGLIPLVNIILGEVIFGGVGSGLYGIIMYIIITLFIAGLMIGRTPEYLGKKIEAKEVKYAMLAMIVMALSILGFTALGILDARGLAGLGNPDKHGFSEVLYAFSSATGNNGSAFAGLSTNTPFWNLTLGVAMFFGRFFMMIPMLGIAGSMVKKKIHPAGEGSFPMDSSLFAILLVGVIFLVGALTFFPALALGPIAEHFDLIQGQNL